MTEVFYFKVATLNKERHLYFFRTGKIAVFKIDQGK